MKARTLLLVMTLLGAATVQAASPAAIPLQGTLKDADGVPLQGSVNMTFGIYDSPQGAMLLWSEVQEVHVQNGFFSVYLGADVALHLGIFHQHSDLWLGIQVGDDAEMNRIYLGSAPFAAYAERSELSDLARACAAGQVARFNGNSWECASTGSGLPSGAVMAFDLDACPPGWTELTEARGRTIVGLPASGTRLGTVGTELSDLAERTVSQVPVHDHPAGGAAVTTSSSGDHTHTLTDPGHAHTYPEWTGGGSGPQGAWMPAGNLNTWNTGTASTGVTVAASGAHTHEIDLPSMSTGATGEASVAVTMPYIQLLLCRKD